MIYFIQRASAPNKFDGDWNEVSESAYYAYKEAAIPGEWARSVYCPAFWTPWMRGETRKDDKMRDRRKGAEDRRATAHPNFYDPPERIERRRDTKMRERWRSIKDAVTYGDPLSTGLPSRCEEAGMRAMYRMLNGDKDEGH